MFAEILQKILETLLYGPLGIGKALTGAAEKPMTRYQNFNLAVDAWLVVFLLGETLIVGTTKAPFPLRESTFISLGAIVACLFMVFVLKIDN